MGFLSKTKKIRLFDNDFKVIIFDFDGVLLKNKTNDTFPGKLLLKINPDLIWPDCYHFKSTNWLEELLNLDIFGDIDRIEKEKILKNFSGALFDHSLIANKALLYGWVKRVMPLLAKKVALAILSNNCGESVSHYLDKSLLNYFSNIKTYECVDDLKPSPEGVELICKELGISPKYALIIGDSEEDLIAAEKAGAKSVLASWNGNEKTKSLAFLFKAGMLPASVLGVFYSPGSMIRAFNLNKK